MLCPIEEVISEKTIVVFSPHFDDFAFMLGGYISELKEKQSLNTKNFHIILLFSRSNYMAGTGKENYDMSTGRIKLVTGKRVIEDLGCIDELLGDFNYHYELVGERECFLRSKPFADSEMEFPHGMYVDFDPDDHQIFMRMIERVRYWSLKKDTALVFPMAIKEHIDHFIVRESGITVAREMGNRTGATFYFQEDKPYGGIASFDELERIERFIESNSLKSRIFEYNPEELISLTFRHYISQVEEVYMTGIRNRAAELQRQIEACRPCDRICVYGKKI